MNSILQQYNSEETIRILQEELENTNAEVLLLTLELEKRVEERTAELKAAQDELKKRNLELLRRTVQLESLNHELEAFSYSVSHDLRAPARRIDGFLTLALEHHGPKLDDEARNFLDRALRSAREMGVLIENLLAFFRMGRAAMQETDFDTNLMVGEIVSDIKNDCPDRTIEWNIRPLPQIHGDPNLLKQVWVNLISNAVKYTRPRVPAKIEIGCLQKPSENQFYVKDNGVGFDMKYSSKLFGVFQRLHRVDEFEGTGVGLANVRQIISKHGGKVWAEAKPGEGATFYFTLPI